MFLQRYIYICICIYRKPVSQRCRTYKLIWKRRMNKKNVIVKGVFKVLSFHWYGSINLLWNQLLQIYLKLLLTSSIPPLYLHYTSSKPSVNLLYTSSKPSVNLLYTSSKPPLNLHYTSSNPSLNLLYTSSSRPSL